MIASSSSSTMDVAEWDRASIRQITGLTREARAQGKWLFVWDRQGTVTTYFRYQGSLHEFDSNYARVKVGSKTASMACKELQEAVFSN